MLCQEFTRLVDTVAYHLHIGIIGGQQADQFLPIGNGGDIIAALHASRSRQRQRRRVVGIEFECLVEVLGRFTQQRLTMAHGLGIGIVGPKLRLVRHQFDQMLIGAHRIIIALQFLIGTPQSEPTIGVFRQFHQLGFQFLQRCFRTNNTETVGSSTLLGGRQQCLGVAKRPIQRNAAQRHQHQQDQRQNFSRIARHASRRFSGFYFIQQAHLQLATTLIISLLG